MKADKDKVLKLLKTARGQVDGIIRMVDEDRYCMDIANQILAAQAVLKSAFSEVIRGHMLSCVKNSIAVNENPDKHISELITLIEKFQQ